MPRIFIGSLTVAKYSLGLVLLVALLQGSSCPWFCDTGSEITLSETQELVGISSSSRAQVEADIDEFVRPCKGLKYIKYQLFNCLIC